MYKIKKKMLIKLHLFWMLLATAGVFYSIFTKDLFYLVLFGGAIALLFFSMTQLKKEVS